MGDALLMFSVPEEVLAVAAVRVCDPRTGKSRPLSDIEPAPSWRGFRGHRPGPPVPGGKRRRPMRLGEIQERYPEAFFELRVPVGAVWDPPAEPRGLTLERSVAARRRHRERMRKSLAAFINGKLARLWGMVRTGWWVLGEARVRVVAMKSVPEYVFAKFSAAAKPRE